MSSPNTRMSRQGWVRLQCGLVKNPSLASRCSSYRSVNFSMATGGAVVLGSTKKTQTTHNLTANLLLRLIYTSGSNLHHRYTVKGHKHKAKHLYLSVRCAPPLGGAVAWNTPEFSVFHCRNNSQTITWTTCCTETNLLEKEGTSRD